MDELEVRTYEDTENTELAENQNGNSGLGVGMLIGAAITGLGCLVVKGVKWGVHKIKEKKNRPEDQETEEELVEVTDK